MERSLAGTLTGGYLLAHGEARLARSVVDTGVIDKYRLVVHPLVLSTGQRLFSAPLIITPISTTAFRGCLAHLFAAQPRYPTRARFGSGPVRAPSHVPLVRTSGRKLCNSPQKPRDPARPGSLVRSKPTAVSPTSPLVWHLDRRTPLQVAVRTIAGAAEEKPSNLTGGHP